MRNPVDHAAMRMDRFHAAQAAATHRRAVIAVPAPDDYPLFGLALDLPVAADKADVGVVGLGAGPCEEHMVQIARRQFREFGSQRDGGDMGGLEEGVVIGQLLHLLGSDLGKFLAAVADVDAPKARHAVEDPVTLAVGQPDALPARDHPRAFAGKTSGIGERVHVVGGVQFLQLGGRQVVGDHVHERTSQNRRGTGPGLIPD